MIDQPEHAFQTVTWARFSPNDDHLTFDEMDNLVKFILGVHNGYLAGVTSPKSRRGGEAL